MAWFKKSSAVEEMRFLVERLKGMHELLEECEGKSILDLGGAEGDIAHCFMLAGAKSAVVVDKEKPERCGVPFIQADFDKEYPCLMGGYDIVLALSVAHKLKDPEAFLLWSASLGKTLVVRTPGNPFMRKKRPSAIYNAVSILDGKATLMQEPQTFDGAWLGIFEVTQ